MLSGLRKRIAKLEALKKKVGPKSFDDFCKEVDNYARCTGTSEEEAMTTLVAHLSNDDLQRFLAEGESLATGKEDSGGQAQSSEPCCD